MVPLASIGALMALLVTSASPMLVEKHIAQTIADSTQQWHICRTRLGGGAQCNTISQNAFTTLLAAGKNYDQQDAADQMVDLAKTLNDNADMTRLAQIFVQQPRHAFTSPLLPDGAEEPRELNGFSRCQFASSDFTKFSGDQTGNLSLGVEAVNPPGSCPARHANPGAHRIDVTSIDFNATTATNGTDASSSGSQNIRSTPDDDDAGDSGGDFGGGGAVDFL
ncbi:hypothetical protein BJV74DRAFT_953620 [Russula compacta]|nr:hypothetical protein BJV74DRAFT_953620 [Russula compacta]